MRSEADVPGVGEIVCGAGFSGRGATQFFSAHAGAELDDLFEHGDHGTGDFGRNHVSNLRARLFENGAIVRGDAANVVRLDVNAVVGENGEGGGVFHQSEIGSAEGERKIGRQGTCDAEFPGKSDYILYADMVEEAHSGNVTRIGESAAIGDAAFESVVVIMRRIILGAAAICDGLVHDGIKGRNALFDGVGVNVNLERAAGLAQGLRGAIEFRFVETVPTDHGFDFTGGVIDSEQGALSGGLLFELDAHGEAGNFLDRDGDEISDFE